MQNIDNHIKRIEDPHIRKALEMIAAELKRIRSIKPVHPDNLKAVAFAVNRIIGRSS